MKAYRVIYNQDCTNLFGIAREPITPTHVDRMVDEVADGGADLILLNPNAQRVNYPSRVWQTFWDGYAPGRREFFGPVPEAEIPGREAWVRQMKGLADQGCDYLTRALARCRHKGITPGVSVRMNDMHDSPTPGTHLFSRFYMEHPELHLHNAGACGWSATGLNFESPAVHDHYLALIKELAHAYDIEALELDFLRFPCYFARDHFAEHAALMTAFLRDIRATLTASGRDIALTARVPSTPAAAYELGFDVAAWAHEGLIDGISAGAFLNTQWAVPVDEFRAAVGTDVAVYACTDFTADRRSGLPIRHLSTNPGFLRGFAAAHLATGADGIELFNFFCSREQAWHAGMQDPAFSALRDMRTLDGLRGMDKTYTLASGMSVGETDGPVQVPVAVEAGQPRNFQMLLAAEPASASVQVDVVFQGNVAAGSDQLWLHVNRTPVGTAHAIKLQPDSTQGARTAVFQIPPEALRDGRNTLALRNEGQPLTVVSLDVHVTHAQA